MKPAKTSSKSVTIIKAGKGNSSAAKTKVLAKIKSASAKHKGKSCK